MPQNLSKLIEYARLTVTVVWLIGALNTKPSVKRQSRASRLLQLGEAILVAELFVQAPRFAPWLRARFVPQSTAAAWTGVVLTWLGLGFVIAARVYLGRNWSGTVTLKHDHTLTRGGPYAIVRHPIYSGFLLAALGTAAFFGQIRGLLILPFALAVMWQKIRIEEHFMTEQFRGEYLAYQRKVKAIIPYIW